jgi:hypothetical protein
VAHFQGDRIFFFPPFFFSSFFSTLFIQRADQLQDESILFFLFNGVRYDTPHFPANASDGPARLSVVFDAMKLNHYSCEWNALLSWGCLKCFSSIDNSVQLCHFILLNHYEAECFFETCVADLLSVPDVV